MQMGNDLKGTVFEIQRMSTEDGPGIRTTVFMKGCSLKCRWCHNPESISIKPQIHWIGSQCIGCKTCIDVCNESALSLSSHGMIIDRDRCNGCGVCADECPSTAMELMGSRWTVEALTNELIKDKSYFEKSGGGITIGGGESTLQTAFVSKLLKDLKRRGFHTAIDTCGQTSKDAFDRILPFTDIVLYDLKEIDPEKHGLFTGSSNEIILENIIHISKTIKSHLFPREMWIRTPIIPGTTATEENINGIGTFIGKNIGKAVTRWELISFNNLCGDKYKRLDMQWHYKDFKLINLELMEKLADVAKCSGVNPEIVQWSGSTEL